MSDSSKNPPKFSSKKDYQSYKLELETWTKVTKHEKKNWGNIVALSLPEDDPSDIRRKVFAAVKFDGDEGYAALIKYLDEEFDRDAVQDTCEKIRLLVTHKKEPGMTMRQYISGFDAKYTLAQKAGLTAMPQEYLMFHVMENCLLTSNEYRLVMSGIDMTKKDSLYKQTKASLIKFFASVKPQHECTTDDNIAAVPHECKLDHEDTLYNAGAYGSNPSPYGSNPNNFYPGAGGRGRFQGPSRGRGGNRGNFTQGQWKNPRGHEPNQRNIQKPLNKFANDGRIMLCNSCGSYRHLQADCPHKFETYVCDETNVQHDGVEEALNQADGGDEEIFTAYNTFDIFAAVPGVIEPDEVFACVVLDTGCVKSVCGQEWLNDFLSTLSHDTKSKIQTFASDRLFKFGGKIKVPSRGFYKIPCSIGGKNIILEIDVVECQIPCLISKEAMKRGKGPMEIEK